MSKIFSKVSMGLALIAVTMQAAHSAAVGTITLKESVPAVVSQLTPVASFSATNTLHLAIGLPLRNQTELNALMAQVYDPASTNYHHFLTTAEFTAQFGPTESDYQSVIDFAKSNGMVVTATAPNRMLLEVSGSAAAVGKAFNVSFNYYQHPTENRTFFAPNTAPTVPSSLAILDVSGLSSYARPYSKIRLNTAKKAQSPISKAGSGPQGSYMGNDFRAAYVPGTALTGAGQKVALVQFDGYFASDIALYAQAAGIGSVSLTNILLNGFSGTPTGTGGEVEVSLDIEMVISMAPGLDQVLVYEGNPYVFNPNGVLNQIAVDNSARQIGCSWGWTGGPNATSEQIFKQMALQGQSFYNASGDSDAFLPGEVDSPAGPGFPSCSPNITQVGGTTLTTTGPAGAWADETVWNWGGGVGSSGGISDYYSIPVWQQWITMTNNHGSTTGRNIPDVALTGDNVYVIADNGIDYPGTGGTSCAAPLWAGFTALINQQAALKGLSPMGFINPALYNLAKTSVYTNVFNDITTGNNTWALSPTNFFAVPGYDLCTGLGTPRGTNLINALTSTTTNVTYVPIVSAPQAPWGTSLAALNGDNPNGAWFLFIQDTSAQQSGVITNGWYITLTSANPVGYVADNQVLASPGVVTSVVGTKEHLVIAVTNYGPSISTNVYVSDTYSAGLTLVSSSPSVGTASQIGSRLVGWNIGTLALGAGATLNLTLTSSSTGTYTNTATVAADTADPNADDDTVSSVFTVTGPSNPPQLATVSYTAGTGFKFHITGDAVTTTIQASTNLVNWVDLYTGTPPFDYTDPAATGYPQRFYRAITAP